MELGVLAPTERGEVHREHHEDPHAHVADEGREPAGPAHGQRHRHLRGLHQPGVAEAVLDAGPDHRGHEPEEVDREQPAVELVEEAADAADDERRRVDDDHEAPHPHLAAELGLERVRHDRALEDGVVDRDEREDDRRDRGSRCAEDRARELGDGRAVVDGVLGQDGVDDAVHDDREHEADERVRRAVGDRHRGADVHVEHGARDAVPRHRERAAAHLVGVVALAGEGVGRFDVVVAPRQVDVHGDTSIGMRSEGGRGGMGYGEG